MFDWGKRERLVQERDTQVRMAELNVDLVRAKVAASVQKASLDLQRTRRIMQLTRQVAQLSRTGPAAYKPGDPDARAALAQVEADMYQADLDYRIAYTELQRALGVVE